MVAITINGTEHQVEEGQSLLSAAEDLGYDIPTLCHFDVVSDAGACRMCLIEDQDSGQLLPSCTTEVSEGMDIVTNNERIYQARKTVLDLLLSEHCGDCEAPCTVACPAHANVEEYVRAGREGDFKKALAIIKERIPLPMSIGRVCPRFCEEDCRRNLMEDEEPVAINDFKRKAADLHYEEYTEPRRELTGEKVAIIGGGPAGLGTAYFLRKWGIAADIYEKREKAGGMLRYGIPEYRLPKDILDKELKHFHEMDGLTINCNQELGTDIEIAELKEDYDAVVIALGCWQSSSMRTEGEELALGGIDFLEQLAKQNFEMEDPGETIVVGGGNTAMDCVRSTLRLTDSDVHCYYRRTEKQMPAEQIEIDEAREEGCNFEFLSQPVSLRKEDGKLVLECIKMELGEPDESGRRRPIPIEGSEFEVTADTVIAAIGQNTIAPDSIPTNDWGDVAVKEDSYQVEDNVFAAGDCVTGPATVVEAVAAARKAALNVECFLQGEEYSEEKQTNVNQGHWESLSMEDLDFLEEPTPQERVELPTEKAEKRVTNFCEVTETISAEGMEKEGERCFECSCTSKTDCELRDLATRFEIEEPFYGGFRSSSGAELEADNPFLVHDDDKCILCGRCVRVDHEVQCSDAIDFANRGFDSRIAAALKEDLGSEDSSCVFCGQCVEACPTGALEYKPFITERLELDVESTETTCGYCGVGCKLDFKTADNKVVKVGSVYREGIPNPDGEACVKGRFGYEFIDHPDRLTKPLIKDKESGEFQEASWEEALDYVADNFQRIKDESGAEAFGSLCSARCSNEENYLIQKLMRAAIGTHTIDHCARL